VIDVLVVLMLLAGITSSTLVTAPPAVAVQSFDNAAVADAGIAEIGTSRPTGWNMPGECIKSMQRWVQAAGGSAANGGIVSSYTNSGAQEVSLGSAVKGDVIQYTNAGGNDNDWTHAHTVVVINNWGNGRFDIVQSNSPPGSGLVTRVSNWAPTPAPGWVARVWRFGTVQVSLPDTDNDGVADINDACPNQWGPYGGCPDSDADVIPDNVDQCPGTPGLGYQDGCRQPVATMRGDYNADGKEDVASFYTYPERGNAASLFLWYGTGSGSVNNPTLVWYTASGWGSDRMIPAGSGDFDEDGRTDIALFYRYPDTTVRVFIWYANATGMNEPVIASTDTAMEGANLVPVGTGDYDGDGNLDIASFYGYPERGNALSLIVWYGNGSGVNAGAVEWYAPSGWNHHLVIPIGSGEFFTDGRGDITAMYNYGGGVVRVFPWYGRADRSFHDPAITFHAPSGWAGEHVIPAGVGDFDADGKDDAAAFYGYPERGNAVGLFIWKGNGDGTFQAPHLSWYTPQWWGWLALKPVGVSDLDGDGRDEISIAYDYGGSTVRFFTWSPDASLNSPEPDMIYYATDMAQPNLRP